MVADDRSENYVVETLPFSEGETNRSVHVSGDFTHEASEVLFSSVVMLLKNGFDHVSVNLLSVTSYWPTALEMFGVLRQFLDLHPGYGITFEVEDPIIRRLLLGEGLL